MIFAEHSPLDWVVTAAKEPRFSQNTLIASRRAALKLIAWAGAEGLAIKTLSEESAGVFHEEATRGRSASHHLQARAALALLYNVLGSRNPFAECGAPKCAPENRSYAITPARNWAALARVASRSLQLLWTSDIISPLLSLLPVVDFTSGRLTR
jgi:hypothetical protein